MKNGKDLFNSKSEPVPRVRPDIDIIPIQENGDPYLYFHDVRGYVTDDFALDRSSATVLTQLDGSTSINDLKPHLGNGVSTDQLLQYVRFLDENRLLYSPYFKSYAETFERQYEDRDVHRSVTAGSSYPADPEELQDHLDEQFEQHGNGASANIADSDTIKALYAPHIDTRVGMKTYVESFSPLRNLQPQRVVMLATSHYAGMHADIYRDRPFILSRKDFEMPLGTVASDEEAIDQFLEGADPETMGLSLNDRAHRIEHSIELHLLFLTYLWQHSFSVVPIVVGGLDELYYMDGSFREQQVARFTSRLRKVFGGDDDTLFLISGDLAHVGRKFGDDRPANTFKHEVQQFDEQFMEAGTANAAGRMLTLMKRNYDPYRICGFPPLYTFLKAFPELRGEAISYDRWDETERESAVTFGSILYQ